MNESEIRLECFRIAVSGGKGDFTAALNAAKAAADFIKTGELKPLRLCTPSVRLRNRK